MLIKIVAMAGKRNNFLETSLPCIRGGDFLSINIRR